ncbi:MAG TPA: response regulator transcription factor [Candidatus Acidoferrales bacterium]|nr:response regulator transcription factor [Candidatus Acidoferrales bacterium]
MSRILIVEDETHIAQGLQFNLEAEGHSVCCVDSGEAACNRLLTHGERYNAVLLDVMLPGIDGFEVASRLRAAQNFVPILMLTARSRPEDVLKGFEAGADDYLPKPFDLKILLARVRSLLRRTEWMQPAPEKKAERRVETYTFAGRKLDFENLSLTSSAGAEFRLTLMEAELLRYLIQHAGRAVSRKQILEEVWQLHEDTDTRAIDNFIVRLRRYIEDQPANPKHLVTVRGVGYRFEADAKED